MGNEDPVFPYSKFIYLLDVGQQIYFISPSSPGSLDKLHQWTLRWLLEHDAYEDATLCTCTSIEEAADILETQLIYGDSPTLVIFDHFDQPEEKNLEFSRQLRNGIPESWIVEIVPGSMPIPESTENLFWVRRPVKEDEWLQTLDLVLLSSGSPQWAD